MTLILAPSLQHEIWEHGSRAYPEEGAGLILGTLDGSRRHATRLLPLPNTFQPESRHRRYRLEARDLLQAELEAERLDLEVLGVYHSHPEHPPRPSEYDRQWALPWYSYVITSVQDGHAVESRSWRLREDRSQFDEEALQILTPIPSEEEA